MLYKNGFYLMDPMKGFGGFKWSTKHTLRTAVIGHLKLDKLIINQKPNRSKEWGDMKINMKINEPLESRKCPAHSQPWAGLFLAKRGNSSLCLTLILKTNEKDNFLKLKHPK